MTSNELTSYQKLITTGWRFGLWWGLAFVGFPIGGVAALGVIGSLDNIFEGFVGGAVTGLIIGLVQWLVLRQTRLIDARWIVFSAGGMALGLAMGVAIVGTGTSTTELMVRGAFSGAFLGLAQWLLLQKIVAQAGWWVLVVTVGFSLSWFITQNVITANVTQGFTIFGSSGALVFQLFSGSLLFQFKRKR